MLYRSFARVVALLALFSVLALGTSAQAQVYYWTTGPRFVELASWSLSTNGSSPVAWPSGGNADFYSGTGTVTVTGTQSVNNITFDTSGYTVSGGALNFGAASVNINANQNGTINSALIGTGAITFGGAANLTLGGNNLSFSGTTNISAGTVTLTNPNALYYSTVNVTGGSLNTNNQSPVIGALSGSGTVIVDAGSGVGTNTGLSIGRTERRPPSAEI